MNSFGARTGVSGHLKFTLPTSTFTHTLYRSGVIQDADVMAGRPLELEALNGAVVRAGRMAQVPTPVNNLIYAMVNPFKDGNPEQAH